MKPMLAATIKDISTLQFPLYASPKLDGIRGVVVDGVLKSRSLKPIPNAFVTKRFSLKKYNGYDGELILGSPTAKDVYRVTNGACARHIGTPDVEFYVFDNYLSPYGFGDRFSTIKNGEAIVVHEHTLVKNAVELLAFENDCLDFGYEGVILRAPQGAYKFGRSTLNEQGMMKLKRFTDSEAEIIEVYEEMENTNEKKTNELGRGARSTHKAGKVPKGRAGGLHLRESKMDFDCGTGLDDSDREFFWKHCHKDKPYTIPGSDHIYYPVDQPGILAKYKSFLIGIKDKPRHPVYLGGREKWDL